MKNSEENIIELISTVLYIFAIMIGLIIGVEIIGISENVHRQVHDPEMPVNISTGIMAINVTKLQENGTEKIRITNIISYDGRNVNSFGYMDTKDLIVRQGEILTEEEFKYKLKIIKEHENIKISGI